MGGKEKKDDRSRKWFLPLVNCIRSASLGKLTHLILSFAFRSAFFCS